MQVASSKVSKNGKKAMLLTMLAQLPQKEQKEIYQRLSQWLNKPPSKNPAVEISRSPNNEFLKSELGQYILSEADARIPIQKVRNALSKIKIPLSQEIIAEREER
jgi:hypothetical protein